MNMFEYFKKKRKAEQDLEYEKERVEINRQLETEEQHYNDLKEELEDQEVCFNCKYADFYYSMHLSKCTRYPPVRVVTHGKYGVSHHDQNPDVSPNQSCGEFKKRVLDNEKM